MLAISNIFYSSPAVKIDNQESKLDLTLKQSAERLLDYVNSYKVYFTNGTKEVSRNAHAYVQGLFKSEKKKATCTGMSEVLQNVRSQNLNHLLTGSPWCYKEVMTQVSSKSNKDLKNHPDTCLLLDDFSFAKKGEKSVGVAHQYLGCLGKKANGQVVVGLTQNCGTHNSIVNARLYLPKCWTSNVTRMEQAGVPWEYQSFKTKPEIALDLIDESLKNGLHFNWLDMDSGYGRSLPLLRKLENRDIIFVADIPADMQIYEQQPILYIPAKKEGRGRPSTKLVTDSVRIEVRKFQEQLSPQDWRTIAVRDATKGDVLIQGYKTRIWVWDKDKTKTQSYILYIKKPLNYDDKISYSLLNVADDLPLERIAFMQGQRFFVEHTYKEGKNQVGLGDAQVRSWQGLHKHLALCMMALHFLMQCRMNTQKLGFKHFTANDFKELICFLIPNKINSVEELIERLKSKYRQYHKDIERNKRKSRKLFVQLE